MASKQAQERIMDASRRVAAYVAEDGLHPTDAVVKVAEDLRPPREYIPLLVQTFNHGQATAHREACESDVLCKIASYPIAVLEDVLDRLYPDKVTKIAEVMQQTGVSDVYSAPPKPRVKFAAARQPLEKVASVSTPIAKSGEWDFRKKQIAAGHAKFAAENARRDASHSADQLVDAMYGLVAYFQKTAFDRLSFAEVEYNAGRMYGSVAKPLLDFVYGEAHLREKRAADAPIFSAVSKDREPYRLLDAAIKAANTACDRYRDWHKAAGLMDATMGATLGSMINKTMEPSQPDALVNKAVLKLNDPGHINNLRAIEAQAMLHDLLQNDEVISGYDPQEVLNAYNEISKLSPDAARQPAIVRPMLRRRLTAGAVEPFEAEQMANVEKTLRQTESIGHGDVLGKAANDILG